MLTSITPSDFPVTENKNQETDYFKHGIEILSDSKTSAEQKDIHLFRNELPNEKYGVEVFHGEENTESKQTQESELALLKEKTKKDLFVVSKNKVEILHNEPEKEGDE
jgi:hypothetical protein